MGLRIVFSGLGKNGVGWACGVAGLAKDPVSDAYVKAIWRQLMIRLIGITRRMQPKLILIIDAQQPSAAHLVICTRSRRKRKVVRIADRVRIVNSCVAHKELAIK